MVGSIDNTRVVKLMVNKSSVQIFAYSYSFMAKVSHEKI